MADYSCRVGIVHPTLNVVQVRPYQPIIFSKWAAPYAKLLITY